MNHFTVRAARSLVPALLLASCASVEAGTLTGEVVGVTDGDTITVLVDRREVKVRLAEIDTAERGKPGSNPAKGTLSEKVLGRIVEVRVVDTDRYGRQVGCVYCDGRDVTREMVREGHACVYRK